MKRHRYAIRSITGASSPCPIFRVSLVALLLLLPCRAGMGNTYYVDGQTGNDNGPGTATAPWKTISKATTSLRPGDTALVRGGTYRETVTIRVAGTESQPIVIQSYPGETPILNGFIPVTGWTRCAAREPGLTVAGVTNPRHANIYKARIAAADLTCDPASIVIVEDDQLLQYAESTTQEDPVYDNVSTFTALSDGRNWNQAACLYDPSLSQTNDYWNGAYIRIWLHSISNFVATARISDFDQATGRITFATALSGGITSQDRYSIFNHPHLLDGPGEFYIDPTPSGGFHAIYLWPHSPSHLETSIEVSKRGTAVWYEPGHGSYTTFEGFTIRGYHAAGIRRAHDNSDHTGLTVRNCTIRNCQGYAAIHIDGGSHVTIEGNTIQNYLDGWGILATNGIRHLIIRNNQVIWAERTGIYTPGATVAQITGNVVRGGDGTHYNGLSVYQKAQDVLIANNIIRGPRPLTMQDSSNLTLFNNVFDGHMVADWGGCSGTLTIVNNCFLGVPEGKSSLSLVSPWQIVTKNNILAGGGCGNRSHNIYVSLSWDQEPRYGWTLGAGESMHRDLSRLFVDAAGGNYRLKEGSPAINGGTAIDAFLPKSKFPDFDFGMDLAGTPRDAIPDIGAYEFGPGGPSGNRPPVLQPVGNRAGAPGQPLSFTLVATDPEGDPVTFSASGMPAGAGLAGSTFTWTPTAGQIGNHPVTFTASDGQTQDSETITISVGRPNAAPILSGITDKTVNENQALAFSVNATDADGDPLTYAATGLPNGATFTGRTFNWTPTYDQAGAYHVTFTASDGRVQDSRTVAISVANINQPPALAGIGDRSTYESNLLAFSLLAADPDGAGLTYSATGLPAGAKLAGQNFSWTPTSGQIGSHEVTFLVSDGTLTDSETITITVTGVAADHTAPVVAQQSPAPGAIQVPLNNLVTLHVADAGRGVDPRSVRIAVDGKLVYQGDTALYTGPYGRCSRSGAGNDYEFIYQPDQMFDFDHEVAVTVNATDLGGNVMHERAYSFATEMRAFGSIKRASAVPLLGKECPVTVSDSSGNIWVAWHSGKPGARDILVAVQPAGQQRFQVEEQITWDSHDQCYPDLALGSNGAVYVVWQDNRRGHWDVYASVCSDGQTFSPNILVTDFEGNQIDPTLVVHPGAPDRVSVAWQDDRNGNQDICVASSTNAFTTVAVTQVTTNAADQTQPDMAVGGANTIYLVWTDSRNGHADIYGAASTNAWGNIPIVASAGDQTSPAVVTPSSGATLHLVWMDNRAGNTDIYYASSSGLPTSPLAGANIVDDTSGADQRAPAIACADNGKVFACWEDLRNVGVHGDDLDVYFVELSSAAAQTNILVGDTGGRANQSRPAVAVSVHDQPYMVWVDDRTRTGEIQCAGTTLIDPAPLHAAIVTAATGATVGANPAAITQTEHVSLVVPPGAAPDNVRITISEIHNPVVSPGDCLGSYDFGPSGIHFAQPVTVTIPYRLGSTSRSARAYWYNSLTGAMSQQGITRIENIRIRGDLYALRFQTTHFTPFYLLADDAEAASSSGGGGGGGCSMSVTGDESPGQLLVPCGLVAVAVMILRRRDRKQALEESA